MFIVDGFQNEELDRIILVQSEDSVKTDLELRCSLCGDHLCDAEPDDTLGVLVRVASDHACIYQKGAGS